MVATEGGECAVALKSRAPVSFRVEAAENLKARKTLRGSGLKASSKVVTRPYYQTQNLSMTENNFLFLIQQKKQFLRK